MKKNLLKQIVTSKWVLILSLAFLAVSCSEDEATDPADVSDENSIGATAQIYFFDNEETVAFEGLNASRIHKKFYGGESFGDELFVLSFEDEKKGIRLELSVTDLGKVGLSPYPMDFNIPTEEDGDDTWATGFLNSNDLIYEAGTYDLNADDKNGSGAIQFTSITETHVTGTFSFIGYTEKGEVAARKVEVTNGKFDCEIYRH